MKVVRIQGNHKLCFYRLTLWGIFSILRSFKTVHAVSRIYSVFRFLFKRLSFLFPPAAQQLHRNACFCERKTGHFNSAFTKPQLLFYICTWINIEISETFIKLLNKTYFLDLKKTKTKFRISKLTCREEGGGGIFVTLLPYFPNNSQSTETLVICSYGIHSSQNNSSLPFCKDNYRWREKRTKHPRSSAPQILRNGRGWERGEENLLMKSNRQIILVKIINFAFKLINHLRVH